MNIVPHLCFDGECREAFAEYQRIFGGKIETMMTYGESPMANDVPKECYDRIVHATLHIDDLEIAGADLLPQDYKRPQGFFVLVSIPILEDAKRIFQLLSEGGIVHLPFAETFWAQGFGVVIDRFETPWEINSNAASPSA